ncbi:3-deoxy-manno-octulosonate cytidylyltransferase [Novosphingobium sp. ERN07]|uniref:3-deoxy-manno-octulosonate cytidylyltransferase n=1 Tax=Novosphingobium sp. ERN07 TaxID=2726187 RepID=UPI001456A40E|nr:3-deoxy-manno-octulosonate cytidylyltransferase [Novosphingobium sp. ERN07]NLR72465.1 3-deoxy-manno-octulosonate cytidylyltransferase [Novosphingobium sp. ERN07]
MDAPSDLPANDLIVVPARYGSSRLPGKPLMALAGRSILERVVANAQAAAAEAGHCAVMVATDDSRIADHAASLGVDCAMTAAELDSGTVRAHAAARQMPIPPARVVNLQGDAPFIPPSIIAGMLRHLRDTRADVITPVFQLGWDRLDRLREHKHSAPFSGTTCIRAGDGRALWFSKTIIPALRNETALRAASPMSPVWQHLGIYGYTIGALDWCATAPPSHYETLESLEQLRFLEGGWHVQTIAVEVPEHLLSGIDTPQDLARAEEAITRFGDPFPA